MNARDLAEIKRRMNPEKRGPATICGRYVDDAGRPICSFRKPVALMPQEELEKYLALFKKTLGGTPGQNLLDISFAASETMPDAAHGMLMELCRSELMEDQAVEALYERVTRWLSARHADQPMSVDAARAAEHWLILLICDSFDVFRRERDKAESADSIFNYVLCCVCPVRMGKSALCYTAAEGDFISREADWTVGMPELGFMYPTLVQGGADLYTAQYYIRDIRDTQEAFVRTVFEAEAQMPPAEQKETFQSILSASLEEECSMDVVQAVQERVTDMIRERKEDKQADPLTLTGPDVSRLLTDCGVSEAKVEAFGQQYDDLFGRYTEIPAVNMVPKKEFRVSTPSVSIKVDPEHRDLVTTRVIDGQRYIMILADGAVEVNGVKVAITE